VKTRPKNEGKVRNFRKQRETDYRTPIISPGIGIRRQCIAKQCNWVEKNCRKFSTSLRKFV